MRGQKAIPRISTTHLIRRLMTLTRIITRMDCDRETLLSREDAEQQYAKIYHELNFRTKILDKLDKKPWEL